MPSDETADHSVDVAIVGLGPTGAVLANILGGSGVRVVVFEREAAPLELPRAVHLDGEVMRTFQSIGLARAIADEVISVSGGVRYYSADGELLMERRPPTTAGTHIWPDKNMFHQPDLERLLRAGLRRYPGVEVLLSHDVLSVVDREDSALITVRDRDTDEQAVWSARYVVGSDGGRSLLRRSVGIGLEDFGVDDPWLVVDVELTEDVELPDCTVQYCDPARPTTYVRVTGNRRRWEFKLMPGDDPYHVTSPESVWRLLSRWVHPGNARLVRSTIYTFHALIAERWRVGRLFLAGDSAHQTPPFLGQGMCTGVRDAANLGWKLALVVSGAADRILDSYESERRPHAQVFVETAAYLGSIIQTTDPDAAAERNARLRAGGTTEFRDPVPPLGAGLHDESGIAARIPSQPTLSDGSMLDDVVGPRFAVIVSRSLSGESLSSGRELACAIGAAWVVDDALERWLEALGVKAVVLRPDRYAFGGAGDAGELAALLRRLSGALALPIESEAVPA